MYGFANKTYRLNIINNSRMPFLQCIYRGSKKAEGRVSSEYIKKFKVGNNLILEGKNEFALCKIVYMNFYESFELMVFKEGAHNLIPFVKDEKEVIKIYKNFTGANRVVDKGCCAIGVKWLNGRVESYKVK